MAIALVTVNLRTKCKVPNFTHYENMKGDTKNVGNGVVWGSSVIQGH